MQEHSIQPQAFIRNARVTTTPPRRQNIPAWEKRLITGVRGDFHTMVRLYVYPATIQFPKPAVNLSITNGNSRCFTQISRQELDILIDTLCHWREEITPILSKLEADASRIEAGLAAYRQVMSMKSAEPEIEGGDDEEIPDEIAEFIVNGSQGQMPIPNVLRTTEGNIITP